MPSNEVLSREIASGCEEGQLIARMREQGVCTLIEDAAEKVFAGETTVRDVLATVTVW
jgi:type II secretory ATPase GspE/PulE/Tfp pilus assembly ATPase PilB-like protein